MENLTLTIDPEIDIEKQEVTFSAASSEPAERYTEDGVKFLEVLVFDEDSVDLSRLNGGASILKNHDDENFIGKIKSAKVENKKLIVRGKFRKNDAESVSIFKDIADATIQNVSVGAMILKDEFKKIDGVLYRFIQKWQPFEISVVGVPADASVGFYRSLNVKEIQKMDEEKVEKAECANADVEALKKELDALKEEVKSLREAQVEDEEVVAEEPAATEEVKDEVATEDVVAEEEEELVVEDETTKSFLQEIGREDLLQRAISEKVIKKDFKEFVKKNLQSKTEGYKVMEKRDLGQVFKGLVNNPSEKFVMRDFSGTTAAGLLPVEHRGGDFVDILRTKMAVKNARFLTGLQGSVTIPAATSASTVAWVAGLNSNASATNPEVEYITLTGKKMTAYVNVTKDLLLSANPDAVNLVIADLTAQIARKLDYTILKGDATASIKGISGSTGVVGVEIASLASATFADMLKFGAVVEDYENINGAEFIMCGADKQLFKGISKDEGSGRYILEDNQIDGYNVNVCGGLSTGDIYFGDFSRVLIGEFGGLEITIDPYSLAISGGVRVIANYTADIAVTNANAFAMRVEEIESSSSSESSSSN